MRKVIRFDTGETAIVYKHSDIRNNLTLKQCMDLLNTRSVAIVPETHEHIWLQF